MGYLKILLVDDSSTSRMIIKRCFEMAGYFDRTFIEAGDGLEGLSALNEEKVDLIVSDLKMPRMDGNTFIKKLKRREKTAKIPVVVISSIGNKYEKDKLKAMNVLGVIEKPLSPEKLINVIGENEDE